MLNDIRFAKENDDKASMAKFKENINLEFNTFIEKTEKAKRNQLRMKEQQYKQKNQHWNWHTLTNRWLNCVNDLLIIGNTSLGGLPINLSTSDFLQYYNF